MDRAQVIGVALLFGCLLFAAHASRADGIEAAAEQLKAAKSSEQLDAVVHQVDKERYELAGRLEDLLRFSSSKAVKVRACFLLGQIHLGNGELERNVDLEATTVEDAAWGRFPCQEALVKLGHGADWSLVNYLALEDDSNKREHLVSVLISWYGASKAAVVVQKVLAEAQGGRADRLAKALKIVQAAAAKPAG